MARILAPPLYGTRLFPASAKQEKFHFMAATSGEIDHFDGDPDLDYITDVKTFMQRMLDGWDYTSNDRDFLQIKSPTLSQDFGKKFPFSIHRLHDKSYHAKKKNQDRDSRTWVRPGTVQQMNTPVHTRPENVQGSTIVNTVRTVTRSDPRRSADELRLAQVSDTILKYIDLTGFLVGGGW